MLPTSAGGSSIQASQTASSGVGPSTSGASMYGSFMTGDISTSGILGNWKMLLVVGGLAVVGLLIWKRRK